MSGNRKAERIYQVLWPFGLHKSNAKVLSAIGGIEALLGAETLPANAQERPPSPADNTKGNSGRRFLEHRLAMQKYLAQWIPLLPATLSWPTYEALASYCESKAGKEA